MLDIIFYSRFVSYRSICIVRSDYKTFSFPFQKTEFVEIW